ncbi:MAG: response regulator transcription factor [Boseongicola sp. SB0677_bin_26]|nr:response regulator transcription factor [Boseongicola sp. SB0677_bin_26]
MTPSAADNANAPWRILAVDDEPHIAENNATALNRASDSQALPHQVQAVAERSFQEALALIGREGFDILVLDVLDQTSADASPHLTDPEPVGRSIFEQIRGTRFLPIIFLTALPSQVEGLHNPPFVQVVSKQADDPIGALTSAVRNCLDSPFPSLYRATRAHIDSVSRQFMVDFVEANWPLLEGRAEDISHLLMRRLGVSFDTGTEALPGGSDHTSTSSSSVPPIRYYVVPPPSDHRMGDVITREMPSNAEGDSNTECFVIMTPSCDLVEGRGKADSVVLAECEPMASFSEWVEVASADEPNKKQRDRLKRLLRSKPERRQENRYFYLPKGWQLPAMMVDFQKITNIPHSELAQFTKQASLDNPYAEALSHQFHCYLGRVGTPDLDLDAEIDQLKEE